MAIFTYSFKSVNDIDGFLVDEDLIPFVAFSDVRLLNEELDNGYMEFIMSDATPLPIFSVIQYEISDGTNTLTRQFYVSRDQVEVKGKYNFTFLHKVELIELTKRFEKHACSTICFTQPSNLSQTKYYKSIEDCLERLIRIEPIGEDDTTVSWSFGNPFSWLPQPNNRIITSVSSIDNDIIPPQFFLQNLTLRQCCDAILKPLNSLSRYALIFDGSGYLTSRQLQYENFNTLVNLVTQSNTIIDTYNEEMDIESYSTNTSSNVDNIVVENENVSPIIYPSSTSYDLVRADENTYLISDSDFGILTDYPIYFINQLITNVELTFDFDDTQSQHQLYVYGDDDIDLTYRVVEQEVYNNLSTYFTSGNNYSNLTKDTTLEYKRGDTFINCSTNYKKIIFTYSSYTKAILLSVAQQTINDRTKYGLSGSTGPSTSYQVIVRTPSWLGNNIMGRIEVSIQSGHEGETTLLSVSDPSIDELLYRIKYTPQYSSRLYFERENSSQHTHKSTNSMNQQQRIVSLQNYGNTIWSNAQRVGTLTYKITARHFAIADLLNIGDFIKNNDGSLAVITETEYIYYNDIIIGKYTFSRDYNRISEYMGIDNEIRQFEIPSNSKSYERKINIQNYVELDTIYKPYDSYLTLYGRNLFMNIFTTNNSSETVNACLYNTEDSDVQNNWGAYDRLLLPIILNGAGNSIIMQFGFNNNITSQPRTTTTSGNKLLKVPIPYAKPSGDYKGFLRNCSFDLYGDTITFPTGMLPLAKSSLVTNNAYVSIPNLLVLKDPSEILQFTYQLNILSKNQNVIIGRKLAENNRFINKNTTKPVIYTKGGSVSRFDNYKLVGGTLQNNMSYSVSLSTPITMSFYDNSVVLSPTNKPSENIYIVDPNTKEIYLIIKKEFFDNNSQIIFNFLKDRSDINNNF